MNITRVGKACSGCGCCKALCPASCIEMTGDDEGFLVPNVDSDRCTNCGLCLARCPVENQAAKPAGFATAVYAARSGDSDVLLNSSSGGIFTEVARATLDANGTVYGAVMDEDDWKVLVRPAKTLEEIKPMRGSKYVQSEIDQSVYSGVRESLERGERVLFTGCPCQVAAIRSYLGREYDGFFAVDIICHGVPSPLLFKTYIEYLEARAGAKVSRYRFRDKRGGWGMRVSYMAGGRAREIPAAFDPYQNCFHRGDINRASCYQCPFARAERAGDMTMGDYWGILKAHPEFYDERGVSVVLVNTPKGEAMFEAIKPRVEWIASDFDKASARNGNLRRPSAKGAMRDDIYHGLRDMPPEEYIRRKLKAKNSPGEILRAILPTGVKKLYTVLTGRKGK